MEFINYNNCSTCLKAKNYLDTHNIEYTDRQIKTQTPTKKELESWLKKYNIVLKKLFNTSGLIYRDLNLKDKLDSMSEDEKLTLLSKNAMLIKRPLLISDDKILIGFRKNEWDEYFEV